MDIISKNKKFKDQLSLFKDFGLNLKGNLKNFANYLIFIGLFVILSSFVEQNINVYNEVNQVASLKNTGANINFADMIFNVINALLTVFVITLPALSILFFKNDNKNIKEKLFQVFSIKLYLNMFITFSLFIIYTFICISIAVPDDFLKPEVLANQQEQKILLEALTDSDKTIASTTLFFYLFTFPIIIFNGIVSYMNFLNFETTILKTFFKTFLHLIKNILFWYLPLLIVSLFLLFIYSQIGILVFDYLILGLILKSIFISVLGYLCFIVYKNMFEVVNFEEIKETNKERIIKKYK